MKTIEPDIQEVILNALPADGPLAMELMCQLMANMILSINEATIHKTVARINFHLGEYEGT